MCILFEGKISVFNLVGGERRRKNSNFHNFRKFRVIRENRTYAMLIIVFYSVHTRNLKKKFGEVFEKILKRLYIMYPQILKNLFQNLKLQLEPIDRGISIWMKSYV